MIGSGIELILNILWFAFIGGAIAIGAITVIGIMVMFAYHAVRIGLAILVVLPLGIACAVADLFFESDRSK